MEYELTQQQGFPYPVRRSNMDDTPEVKSATTDEVPVGRPESENEVAKKEADEKNKKTAYLKATQDQQEKARKAWEEANKKVESMGVKLSDEDLKKQEALITQGITPRHAGLSGASVGGPFAKIDPEKYKGTQLEDLAKQLKEAGEKEEITQELLDSIEEQANIYATLGGVDENVHRQFTADINRATQEGKLSSEGDQTLEDTPVVEPANRNEQVDLSGDLGFENIRQLLNDLADPNMQDKVQETMDSLKQVMRDLAQPFDDRKIRGEKIKELQNISKINNPAELQAQLFPLLEQAIAKRRKNYSEGKVEVPGEINSIQDLAKFIMNKQESALYGAYRKYALIDYVKDPESGETKEVFRPDNFLIWVRDQIIQLHDDNRTSEMQPLSAVAIETQLRTVTIYMMNRFRGQYFRDQNTGQIMNDLAESAVNMCYLYGFFRNMDLAYRQVMNSDEELPKTIVGIHAKNDVTHADNWAQFLSMPDKFGQAVKKADGSVASDKDTRVGDAELVISDIYYNLSDIEELEDIVGKDSTMMTKDGFKKTLLLQQVLAGQKKEWDKEPDDRPGVYDKEVDNFYTINPDTGKKNYVFEGSKVNAKNYLAFVNFFNAPTPDKTNVDFVRDMIRIAAAEKVGIETGFARDESELAQRKTDYEKAKVEKSESEADNEYIRTVSASRINSKFAEYSSYVQQRPLMVAARNDVNRRGYDASTKLDLNYIVRQSGAGTAGPIGSTEFLKHQIIKNFGVDFVAGLKTENKRSPYEIFRDIRHVMNDNSLTELQKDQRKAALLAQLRFQESAASDYASNAAKRQFDIFHQVVDAHSLDLDKIITRNIFEGIKYNTAEFEKQVKDDFIKPMRYAFSSNAALKYGQLYHGFEMMDKKTGMPIYKWKTLADHMFGDEVLDDVREDAVKNKLKIEKYDENNNLIENATNNMTPFERYQEYLNTSESRGRLVKNITRARLAAELRKHRKLYGPAQRWNADMVNKFLLALESIKSFEKDENGNIVEIDQRFFTDKDISWIRKNSGTGYKSMIAKEGLWGATKGGVKGLFDALDDFIDGIFK